LAHLLAARPTVTPKHAKEPISAFPEPFMRNLG